MASNLDAGVGQHATVTNPTGSGWFCNSEPADSCRGLVAAKSLTPGSLRVTLWSLNWSSVPAAGTLVGTTSTKGDGTETGVATTGFRFRC